MDQSGNSDTDPYQAWTVCRDADRWVDEDAVKLYRAAERLASYVEELQGERDGLLAENKRLSAKNAQCVAALKLAEAYIVTDGVK